MHLLESYALLSGQKLRKPDVQEKFFPLPFDNYIVLHATTKDAKTYDLYSSVLDLLEPALKSAQIRVVEVGSQGQNPNRGTHSIIGQTSISQLFHVIKHAKLVFGADSISAHVAGVFNVPFVGLYANTNYVECVKPYFGDPSKQSLLLAESSGNKPSFALAEQPKSINTIKPEAVAREVCRLLGLPFDFPYETAHVGGVYPKSFIEVIPNRVVNISNAKVDCISVRMDYEFNEENLFQQIHYYKAAIVTKKPISLDLLRNVRPQIVELVFQVTEEDHSAWLAEVQKLGIQLALFTYLSDETLNPLKEKYLMFPVINRKTNLKPDKLKNIPSDQLFCTSNRFILSNGKTYLSVAHAQNDISVPGFDFHIQPVIDNGDFWAEESAMWFLKKLS